jgi:Family of unknown function (DUF6174)
MRTTTVLGLAALAVTLCGCGTDSSGARAVASVDPGALPTSYRMVLHADCGERQLIGDFDLRVRDGRVVEAGPPRLLHRTALELDDFPTLVDLVDMAANAEPDADVELRTDDSGIPTSLRIDHDPSSIDDEECYRVTGLRPLAG